MKKTLLILPLIASLTACGSFKYGGQVEVDTKPAFGKASHGDEVRYPDWFTEKEKDSALYAVASEYSEDFQFAVDKATLSAKRDLAANFSSHINAMMKDYANEIGADGTVMREIDRTTKNIISKVNLVGVQKTNFKVQHENKGYRAFVKLRYAIDDSNKFLLAEIKKNRQLQHKLNASRAFRELEREIDAIESGEKNVNDSPIISREGVDVKPVR